MSIIVLTFPQVGKSKACELEKKYRLVDLKEEYIEGGNIRAYVDTLNTTVGFDGEPDLVLMTWSQALVAELKVQNYVYDIVMPLKSRKGEFIDTLEDNGNPMYADILDDMWETSWEMMRADEDCEDVYILGEGMYLTDIVENIVLDDGSGVYTKQGRMAI